MTEFTMQDAIIQSIFSFIACYGYSIICNAPRKELLYCGINGFFGWFFYVLVMMQSGSPTSATLVATMVVTAVSRFFSYHREAPSILYHIPGVLPLVPGAAVYNTMQAAIESDILSTYSYALSGLKLSGAIGLGSLLILALPYRVFEIIPRFGRKKD